MIAKYDFSDQKKLFQIAYEILEDYDIKEWSFGGGTALSYIFYQHRMSYDIDIFSEDFSAIDILISHRDEIAQNLGISLREVEVSPSGITFILNEHGHGLKLDFIYQSPLTTASYSYIDVFGYSNIKVQTPLEIIAKKLKYRSIITVRDFVDFAIVQTKEELLTKLKFENIVDIDRYLEMEEQFNDFNEIAFDKELLYLSAPNFAQKSDLYQTINNIMKPSEIIEVALDATGEVVAFDHFIPVYRDFYEELGDYMIYTLSRSRVLSYLNKTDIDYNDILILRDNDIKLIKD